MAAPLQGHIAEALMLLALFTTVLLMRSHDSKASPNLFISHLHKQNQLVRESENLVHNLTSTVRAAAGAPRVALCLVGGARAFELTAGTIQCHVIEGSGWRPDIFLHAPLDSNAHKFTLLQNVTHLAAARIFHPEVIPETDLRRELLSGGSSPRGIQGLLQYFSLVEGCLDLVARHEEKWGFRYDWVARTRVDGFWSAPPPRLESLDAARYYVPVGSRFGGLNDRFGLGNRSATVAALSRVALLPLLHDRGLRNLNSESAFQAQLEALQVPAAAIPVPFCVLSKRTYPWPGNVPVASILTPGALNGAKCRPCTPAVTGHDAERVVSKMSARWGWSGDVAGMELCDGSSDWEEDWEKIYEAAVGGRYNRSAMVRTREECVRDVLRFGRRWEDWDAPPAEQICGFTST